MTNDSIRDIIIKFFMEHPNIEYTHGPVVDNVTNEYRKTHYQPPRDPWRQIRQLHQDGFLVKVRKGVYKYDPKAVSNNTLEEFSSEQKDEIFRRDNYRCVICGLGVNDGIEIHADHIKPKDRGGKAEIDNGQTLCASHNFQKKNYKATESGKKMFIHLYEAAKNINDLRTMAFCKEILGTYEKHNINGHIEWTP